MHVHKVKIKNFRLLKDVELKLESGTTLIVGRNNSGKTSLSELMRRFLDESYRKYKKFRLEDFSESCRNNFIEALLEYSNNNESSKVRELLPYIELRLFIKYNKNESFRSLGDFIIDIDEDCFEAQVVLTYEIKNGMIGNLFEGPDGVPLKEGEKSLFFRELKRRIGSMYSTTIYAEEPNNPKNRKKITEASILSGLQKTSYISAQRGLDDDTSKNSNVLSKIVEGLFTTATLTGADENDKANVEALRKAVMKAQEGIDHGFNERLDKLIPKLSQFGYPGLGGPKLLTETILDVERLLSNHTEICYEGENGVHLPESYNGLGMRNLIFILLRIEGFYKEYCASNSAPGIHIIFIEEPEAHLHPQMQEVFIDKIQAIIDLYNKNKKECDIWPVQFVVSTHSSHIANKEGFESTRYFMSHKSSAGMRESKVKDLSAGLLKTAEETNKFVHQYLTLTRCDLFFADKVILIEGTSERILLPVFIKKLEEIYPCHVNLSSQYVATLEVGGAYAYKFFDLLEFLELKSLVITDIDSVKTKSGESCPVNIGNFTSNSTIKKWFPKENGDLSKICAQIDEQKVSNNKRIAYQIPEQDGMPCGRSLEDAFILANLMEFNLDDKLPKNELAQEAYNLAKNYKKSNFALKYAIEKNNWIAPKYIIDGLKWLSEN
ncbi:MAG: AAA family ATPase [Magnetococcales bacterium]|nr:AAA family ATPase [Magnetococcales bacterium]